MQQEAVAGNTGKTKKTGWPGLGVSAGRVRRVGREPLGLARQGRQTDRRPYGSQEMSVSNRNGCLLF
ncbi:hypothetical protein AWB67_00980 [Caballeronia terrestris]|uniref:Uncharacterized protein n=1 Tax=Caballeronia terrestris TaxID=1226301 RepID=A0A158FZI1_9BURK|nr:hypothetical protein AWB67_00980 [Caballeronia terrestris]